MRALWWQLTHRPWQLIRRAWLRSGGIVICTACWEFDGIAVPALDDDNYFVEPTCQACNERAHEQRTR